MKGWTGLLLLVGLLAAAPQTRAESAESVETVRSVETVSVVGVGRVPISPTANAVEANTAYHATLVQAVGDGLLKARLLAEATGAKVGPIEAISEGGRKRIECKNSAGESASYKGAEPDSGSAGAPTIAVEPTVAPKPSAKPVAKKKRKARKGVERKARVRVIARAAENTAATCELGGEVTLVYDLEAPS